MRSLLIALPLMDQGGPDKVMFEVTQGLVSRGWAVSVALCSPEGNYARRLSSQIEIVGLRQGRVRLLRRYPVFSLAREVRRRRPDIVLTTLSMNATAGLGRGLWPRRTRLVMRVANHVSSSTKELATGGSRYRLAAFVDRRALKRADAVVAQSHSMANDLIGTTPARSIVVIGNPVGSMEWPVMADRLPGNPAVVAVGRLSNQKGFDLLIDALPKVIEQFPDIHVTIFGTGPQRTSLEQSVRTLGLTRHVSLPGQSSRVHSAMAGADLFVSPSRYEGFSNVILEALLVGTPVVATTCPGAAAEVIQPGLNGLLVPPEDRDGLTRAICEALDGRHSWNRSRISTDVQSVWSVERIVTEYETLLEGLLSTLKGSTA
jgi:glycosyltransferase involved in cell wall biosynthesis